MAKMKSNMIEQQNVVGNPPSDKSDVGYFTYKAKLNALNPGLGTETNDYDLRGAYEAGLKPSKADDGTYHLGSRDPNTGRILKRPGHPTWDKMVEEEERMG